MKNGKHVILCIDDDNDFLDSMRIILEANQYVMETANSAEEGVKRYKEVKPDLIVVDLMMEEIDAGTAFVREVRALGGVTPPIYMLSSMGDNLNLNVDYSELGLAGVLQKPINPPTLLSALKARLGK